jgi:hypothetical protein
MFNISNPEYTINEKSQPISTTLLRYFRRRERYGDKKYGNGIRHVKRGAKIIVKSFNNRPENKGIDEAKEMF